MSVAVQNNDYSIIFLLLEYGAIPSASLGDLACQLLNHADVKHAKIVQELIDQNVINLTLESIFLAAFSFEFTRGSVELADRMLSNDSYSEVDQLYPDAMYYSAKNTWPTILSKLFETSGYTTMVHGRGCNPHRSTTTFAKPEITSFMTS